ncbi:MAG: penicillin-binding protein 2 [Holosporaceae bacterium]|nr:penicillin-binding protein 2 [Holosporaceae bacterium]
MYVDDKSKIDRRRRLRIVLFAVMALGMSLLANLYVLQVHNAGKYSLLSDKNRIRLSPLLPKRGRLMTADGKVIASCVFRRRLVMDSCSEKIFLENMAILGDRLGFSDGERRRIFDLREKTGAYMPMVIRDGLSWDEYARISMVLFRLNCVSIENIPVRRYDMPLEFCHVVGHTGRGADNVPILVGKTGLEAFLNHQLTGAIGNIQTEVNALLKKIRVIDSEPAVNGNDVMLTIDSEVQKYAHDLILEKKAGACLVLDVSNAEILALVSVPGFDANMISGRMTRDQWKSITEDPLSPLLNRAVNGSYPPGSIFKIVTAFAALSEGVISPHDRIFCSGGVQQDDRLFHCWNRSGHGYLDIYGAISLSCDCFFFEVAKRLGIEKIIKYARKFGFGAETGIELPKENIGLLPTKKWKFLRYGSLWRPYETLITAIGQGALLSTLLQLAAMMGKIYANDYNFTPILIKGTKRKRSPEPMDSKPLDVIKQALRYVCAWGTASNSCNADYGIAGKTGSSQVRKIREEDAGVNQQNFQWKLRDHALFVGCAPHKNPRYVVAVLIEHGGGGASVAAPIARKIFDRLVTGKNVD